MRASSVAVAWFAVCLGVGRTAMASTSPEVTALFNRLDLDHDTRLSEAELRSALATPVRLVAELSGTTTPVDRLIQDVVDRALNLIGKDMVAVDDMDSFLAFRFDPPIAVSLRDVLLQQQSIPKPERSGRSLATWIQIRQSALDEQSSGRPAKLSYASRDTADESAVKDSRSQWNTNSAIILNSQKDLPLKKVALTPLFAYEVAVNSDKPAKDRLVTRVGMLGSKTPKDSLIDSHYFQATGDFTTDRKYKARIWGATGEYSPTIDELAIGVFTPGDGIKFRWRPYLGLEYGHVSKAGLLSDLDDNFANAFLRLQPELVMFGRLKVAPTFHWWRQLAHEDDNDWFHYEEWAGRVVLSESDGHERVSVELSYNHGRESPAFAETGILNISLAVKF